MDPTATIEPAAAAESTSQPALPRGAKLDRYVVLEPLGSGGMGVVYLAFDPTLNRRIALKIVHPRHGEAASRKDIQRRLTQEARALAKLNHPNVLTIYDVGSVGGQVFLATELIDGWDLATWLSDSPRSRREILDVFHQAGCGLSAAHDAGLVHRDFKLSNVMVSQEGDARVVDFGLASRRQQPLARTAGADARTAETRVLGTPSYAAPEQLAGRTVGAAADQFSFCVSLFRALCGTPPFPTEAAQAPLDADSWTIEPAILALPARLRRLLRRGLSFVPSARYPSMAELLKDLDASRDRRRRHWLATATVAIALGAGLASWSANTLERQRLCQGGGERFDEVWSQSRRSEIAARFGASDLAYAEASRQGVEAILDRYASQWAGMYEEACVATVVEEVQSTTLLDHRMACLDQRLREVDALAEILIRGDDVIEPAVQAAGALSTVSQCADVRALLATETLPADSKQTNRVEELRQQLNSLKAILLTGANSSGRDQASELVAAAQSLGYWPLLAEAQLLLGRFEEHLDRPMAADEALGLALEAAVAGDHSRVVAESFVRRVRVVGYQQADFTRGTRLSHQATAALGKLSRPDDLAATLAGNYGAVLVEQGDFDAALEAHHSALEIRLRDLGPEHPKTGIALTRIGDVLLLTDDLTESAAHYERALEINRAVNGDLHPQTARLHSKLGVVLLKQGELEPAQAHFTRAVEALRLPSGPAHPYLPTPLTYLGNALLARGEAGQAVAHFREALEILQQSDNSDDRRLAVISSSLGRAASDADDYDEARRSYQRALALRESVYGKNHPAVAETAFNLGEVAKKQGDYASALRLYRRALDTWQSHQPDNAFLIAVALTGIGEALIGSGEFQDAAAALERAMELQPDGRAPEFLATTQFALAQALDELGLEGDRACALANSSRAGFRQAGVTSRRELERVEAWLEARSSDRSREDHQAAYGLQCSEDNRRP